VGPASRSGERPVGGDFTTDRWFKNETIEETAAGECGPTGLDALLGSGDGARGTELTPSIMRDTRGNLGVPSEARGAPAGISGAVARFAGSSDTSFRAIDEAEPGSTERAAVLVVGAGAAGGLATDGVATSPSRWAEVRPGAFEVSAAPALVGDEETSGVRPASMRRKPGGEGHISTEDDGSRSACPGTALGDPPPSADGDTAAPATRSTTERARDCAPVAAEAGPSGEGGWLAARADAAMEAGEAESVVVRAASADEVGATSRAAEASGGRGASGRATRSRTDGVSALRETVALLLADPESTESASCPEAPSDLRPAGAGEVGAGDDDGDTGPASEGDPEPGSALREIGAGGIGSAGIEVVEDGAPASRPTGATELLEGWADGAGDVGAELGAGDEGARSVGAASRRMLRPGGGAITSGSDAAEKTRATTSAPGMFVRTRSGRRPMSRGIGGATKRLAALQAPGRAPRRLRIPVRASAPPASGIGGVTVRETLGGAVVVVSVGTGTLTAGASAARAASVERATSEAALAAGAGVDALDPSEARAALVGAGAGVAVPGARRAVGVDSSTDARRRAGAAAGAPLVEGVTVSDWLRTVRPRTVVERATGAA